MEEISFREIAEKAEVPESSAYHFYANKYDLFSAVATETLALFREAFIQPIPDRSVETWHDVIGKMVDRSIEVFRTQAVARECLVGPKTPPEIKPDEAALGEILSVLADQLRGHFDLSGMSDLENKLKIALVLLDAVMTASLKEFERITDDIANEAKRACIGYLSTYLPENLERHRSALSEWDEFPL